LVRLAETTAAWSTAIATHLAIRRDNGITEDLHTKMEVLQRQAYGCCNFNNYRPRVKVLCS
jgi:transposase